jgi:hypothetical protein
MRFFLGLMLALSLRAELTRIELVERTDYRGGQSFGPAGPYELIRAKAFFEADPSLPANQIIVDLALAPRNERGRVEWSADIVVLKPRDSSKGNGTLLYEVSNRGNFAVQNMFSLAANDPFLLEQGYEIVAAGWQWDIPADFKDGLRLYPPVATDNGKPIRGLVRAEFIPPARSTRMWLGDRNHVPYPVVDGLKLTVRSAPLEERRPVPASAIKVTEGGQAIEMAAGFEPGRIYEAVYTSENPKVAGLGLATARDTVSFFKYGGGGLLLNAERRFVKRSLGFGVSQSGRFLRKFLYDGFNADEKGRLVFDGLWAHVAGAGRGSFNQRFAQASRDGGPWLNLFYPTDIEPFDDSTLLEKARAAKVEPKMFETNGSYEYWGRNAALTHIKPDGSGDGAIAPNVRRYFVAGAQHSPGAFPPAESKTAQYPLNAVEYRFVTRALLTAMNAWLTTGKEPPPSSVPTVAAGELIPFDRVTLPSTLPAAPKHPHRAYRVNYGPEFTVTGIATKEPPEVGAPFATLVPAPDRDGNDRGGVRLPQVAVPLAVYTGWNRRAKDMGAADEMGDLIGATFPLPKSRLAELYAGEDDYANKSLAQGRALVKQGLMLEEDLLDMLTRARAQWRHFESLHSK